MGARHAFFLASDSQEIHRLPEFCNYLSSNRNKDEPTFDSTLVTGLHIYCYLRTIGTNGNFQYNLWWH